MEQRPRARPDRPRRRRHLLDLQDGGHNQIRPDNEATALQDFDFALADPAFGPVYVQDAQPGDLLKVEVLSLTTADCE